MSEDNVKEHLIRSIDRMRSTAGKIETDLIELQNILRFDHRSDGARKRVEGLEAKLSQLAGDVRQLKEHCEQAQAAP